MDDVITLISEEVTSYDIYGNPIRSVSENEVLCKVNGVTRSEFYSAAVAGLKPELVIRLSDQADYNGEEKAVFHDQEYDIIRVYRGTNSFSGMEIGNVELTLQKRVANG